MAQHNRIFAATISVAALAMATVAHGQEAAPQASVQSTDSGYAEIIVTANKRQQSINDVGLSITAETGDSLVARGITSPTDLGKIVPGLTVQPSPLVVSHGVV